MTTATGSALLDVADMSQWYTIDHDGSPSSVGRTLSSPNFYPFSEGRGGDIHVEIVQLSDGSFDPMTLLIRCNANIDDYSGEDARRVARAPRCSTGGPTRWQVVPAMSTTTFHGLGRSAIENTFRPEANDELCELFNAVPVHQLTYGELLGVIAILRAARDRINAGCQSGPAKLAVITGRTRRVRR